MLLEVLGRWEDEDSREPLAVVAAKVSLVAGEQMRGFGGNGREKNGLVVVGKDHLGWQPRQ